jgi:hypothetical protein
MSTTDTEHDRPVAVVVEVRIKAPAYPEADGRFSVIVHTSLPAARPPARSRIESGRGSGRTFTSRAGG